MICDFITLFKLITMKKFYFVSILLILNINLFSQDISRNKFFIEAGGSSLFYSVNYDLDEPYNVYGGIQDNGVWKGPSTYKESSSWHSSGKYPYSMLIGGDGMQVEIDTRNNDIVYTGYQFGNYMMVP